jgi:hypothetical protein
MAAGLASYGPMAVEYDVNSENCPPSAAFAAAGKVSGAPGGMGRCLLLRPSSDPFRPPPAPRTPSRCTRTRWEPARAATRCVGPPGGASDSKHGRKTRLHNADRRPRPPPILQAASTSSVLVERPFQRQASSGGEPATPPPRPPRAAAAAAARPSPDRPPPAQPCGGPPRSERRMRGAAAPQPRLGAHRAHAPPPPPRARRPRAVRAVQAPPAGRRHRREQRRQPAGVRRVRARHL